ncbi:unnamed protein product [Arctogadus glacialis]
MQSNPVLDRKIHCTMGTLYLYHGEMQVANAIKCLKVPTLSLQIRPPVLSTNQKHFLHSNSPPPPPPPPAYLHPPPSGGHRALKAGSPAIVTIPPASRHIQGKPSPCRLHGSIIP